MTYCVSDIHGKFQRFQKMLNKISFSEQDTLYVLGDAIDRGPDGIKIIQYIMKHPNIILLIGNHEHMMLEFFKYQTANHYIQWAKNGGDVTFNAFMKLSEEEQNSIINFLTGCLIYVPRLTVNNRVFTLAHAAPSEYTRPLYYKNAFSFDIQEITWNRSFAQNPMDFFKDCPRILKQNKGNYFIFGHTPVISTPYGKITKHHQPLISRHNKYIIDIDCGCGHSVGRLGCICLDNFNTYYI